MAFSYRYKKDFPDGLGEVLLPIQDFAPYPRYGQAQQWQNLPQRVKDSILQTAQACVDKEIPPISATTYLQYYRTGDRPFDILHATRVQNMQMLAFAECIERKGRFLNTLIDYIWAVCEMTTWVYPTHLWDGPEYFTGDADIAPLADVNDPSIDLGAGIMGEALSWVWYIMGQELDKVSLLIGRRIAYEIEKRILTPFYNRRDKWWVTTSTHNWHIWITSNCLACVLLMEKNPAQRVLGAEIALRYTEEYLYSYPSDGGNGEGASYWGRSAGALFTALVLLQQASGGKIDYRNEPLVRTLARFPLAIHITANEFYNFGFCGRYSDNLQTAFFFGDYLGDDELTGMAAQALHGGEAKTAQLPLFWGGNVSRCLYEVFHYQALMDCGKEDPRGDFFWLPLLQVLCAREKAGSPEGLFVGTKGNNGDAQRHLDGGSFILYKDEQPVFIDVGNATYTRFLINDKYRYQHFCVVTDHHNAVLIGGLGQNKCEESYTPVECENTADQAALTVHLDTAYPAAAGVKSFTRTNTLHRDTGTFTVRQQLALQEKKSVDTVFVSVQQPRPGEGKIEVNGVCLTYDSSLFTARIEKIDLDDRAVQGAWGECLWQTVLHAETDCMDTVFTMRKVD